MADRYGNDQESYPFDASGRRLTGPAVLVRDAYKRLTTQAGALWWSPTATFDVRSLALAPIDTRGLAQQGEALTLLFEDDVRADYRVTAEYAAAELHITCVIQPTDGPALTATINAATGALEVAPA